MREAVGPKLNELDSMKSRLGSTGKGFVQILGGGVGAQIVTVAALPLLSRLYTPEEFGAFTLIVSLATLIVPAATLRFETAAMLPEDIPRVRALVWNALMSTVAIALAYGLVLQLIANQFDDDPGWTPELPAWVVLTVVLMGSFAVFSQLALRKQEYGLVARRTLVRSLAIAGVQCGAGLMGHTGVGLIVGNTLGGAVGISSMYTRTREFVRFPGWLTIRAAWRDFWRFPAVFAPSALMNAAGRQAPIIFFTLWFGITAGGQLGMAERIVSLPLALIGASVGQVLDAEISRRIRERQKGLLRAYLRVSSMLALMGLVIALGMGLLAGWLIPWALGEQWRLAGEIVQVLAITAGIRFIANPLSKFVVLLQRSLANLILDLTRVALLAMTIAATVAFHLDLITALWLVYSGLSVTYALTWLYVLLLVRSHDHTEGREERTGDN